MLSNKKVELLFALVLVVVAVVRSEDKNLLLEDNKDVKRIVNDYLETKNGEQLMSGRFGKRETDEGDSDDEDSSEYENEYDDELENQGLANVRYERQLMRGRFGREKNAVSNEDQWLGGRFGREAATQWFNGRFGRDIEGRFLPRFAKESNKPHLRGRFGRAAKL
ncbi:pol-RFamide neuropeptides [Hydra vulgaris]|uniref:Pol-RFamide neuropeptides n=1 Tax=Hydra vulgaris TaxID=6087 RepID=A0ABM4CJX4_HYDVU